MCCTAIMLVPWSFGACADAELSPNAVADQYDVSALFGATPEGTENRGMNGMTVEAWNSNLQVGHRISATCNM